MERAMSKLKLISQITAFQDKPRNKKKVTEFRSPLFGKCTVEALVILNILVEYIEQR